MIEPICFSVFEVISNKRGRTWKWSVRTNDGKVIMQGCEGTRPAARYRANSALLLLLASAPYRLVPQAAAPRRRTSRQAPPE